MANEVKQMAVERKRSLSKIDQIEEDTYDGLSPKIDPDGTVHRVDSQLLITLYEGEREPAIVCTKPGRMTGQMIMGLEGMGMRRIEVVLRQAQNAITSRPERNERSLEQRVYITPENSPNG